MLMALPLFDDSRFSMGQITWFFVAIYRHHLIDKLVISSPVKSCRGKIMSIQGIEGVISQLQATAGVAKNQSVDAESTVSFAGQLHAALDRISDTQNAARTQAEKFTLGEPGVALNDVMTDLQKSSVSLQMGIQVRNKLVSAYQDVMAMQV